MKTRFAGFLPLDKLGVGMTNILIILRGDLDRLFRTHGMTTAVQFSSLFSRSIVPSNSGPNPARPFAGFVCRFSLATDPSRHDSCSAMPSCHTDTGQDYSTKARCSSSSIGILATFRHAIIDTIPSTTASFAQLSHTPLNDFWPAEIRARALPATNAPNAGRAWPSLSLAIHTAPPMLMVLHSCFFASDIDFDRVMESPGSS